MAAIFKPAAVFVKRQAGRPRHHVVVRWKRTAVRARTLAVSSSARRATPLFRASCDQASAHYVMRLGGDRAGLISGSPEDAATLVSLGINDRFPEGSALLARTCRLPCFRWDPALLPLCGLSSLDGPLRR